MSCSDLTRVASSALVSQPDLVLTSLPSPGHSLSDDRVCVTAPAPARAYSRPLLYTVVGVDSANNTGAIGNIIRVSMQWQPRPERINAATVEVSMIFFMVRIFEKLFGGPKPEPWLSLLRMPLACHIIFLFYWSKQV